MGQLKLTPRDNLSSRDAGRLKAEANCQVVAGANGRLRSAEEQTTARIAQRFAHRAQFVAASADQQFAGHTPPSLLTPSPRIRTLDAILILVALLPSLTFGAMFWLGAISMPWSRVTLPPNGGPVPAVQSASAAGTLAPENPQLQRAAKIPPVLTAPATLEAKAGEDVSFTIALDGTDGVPARSIIAISGLPRGSTLSSGLPYGEAEWNLKSDEIGDLHLVLPKTASGESKLRIQLITPDGDFVADTETVLKVTADSDPAPAPGATDNPNLITISAPDIKPELADAQAQHEPVQELGTMGAQAKIVDPEVAKATSGDPVQLPPSGPAPAANDDAGSWIVLLAFVNLREGPSSSAPVISEMPKGAKLRVLDRKRGWVQVTNPATSETGWVYAGNVAAASKSRHGSLRAVPSKVRSGLDDSLWTDLSQWLASP
jgi:hypothetical protein